MTSLSRLLCLIILLLITADSSAWAETWAQRLGWPDDVRVLILHADDIGMCYEANASAKSYLEAGDIQSAALMVPCPWYNEMANWYSEHPDYDLGLHLTLTSEWKWYRWGPVAGQTKVPGLVDKEGYLFRSVIGVATSASADEIETEIRAQIDKAIKVGPRPGHIDTHMGTLFARPDYTQVYLKLAEEYRIPAMAIEMTPETTEKFVKQGYPMSKEMVQVLANYKLPKLDDFHAAPEGKTYEEKKQNFFALVQSMKPGLHEMIFHPSFETEGLRKITGSWQQRDWEAKMFSDPSVKSFLQGQGVQFTNWKEIMSRFDQAK